MAEASAPVIEVFTSIQGEGVLAGQSHLFIRTAGCNLTCDYCDTPGSRAEGKGTDMSVSALFEQIAGEKSPFDAISFTGGEPLLHPVFVREAARSFRSDPRTARTLLLETNGTLPEALEHVIPYIDIVSMDVKLPSATGKDLFAEHGRFLKTAYIKQPYVKVVLHDRTPGQEFERAIRLVAEIDPAIPFYIQPASAYGTMNRQLSPQHCMSAYAQARKSLTNVRLMPQIHKQMGLS